MLAFLIELAATVAGQFRVLEVDGRRVFGYESVYFDTPRLSSYRAHLQRRRRRVRESAVASHPPGGPTG